MFCPKCATNNVDGAHFCRGCGANISLVPQALTGQLMQAPAEDIDERGRRRRRRGREDTLDQAFKNIFMGVAFLVLAIVLSRTIGQWWWLFMLFPAFSMLGQGVAQFIRIKEREKRTLIAPPARQAFVQQPPEELRAPPASVTEGTTRHLGVEAPPTRQFDASEHK